jgi:hypothetical protein
MTVAWSTEHCVPPEALGEDDRRRRDALIHVGVGIDAGSLSEETICEWFVRIRLLEARYQVEPDHWFDGTPTAEVLRRWVGLKFNTDAVSRQEWWMRFLISDGEKADREFFREFIANR